MILLLKVLAAVIVGFSVSAIVAVLAFLSDIGPHEGPLDRALFLWLLLSLGGLYIGFTLPRAWPLSIFITLYLISGIGPMFNYASESQYNNVWWIAFNTTIVSPLVALGAGRLGALFHNSLNKEQPITRTSKYSQFVIQAVPPLLCLVLVINVTMHNNEKTAVQGISLSSGSDSGGSDGYTSYIEPTPDLLHKAAENGDLEQIIHLIEKGKNINILDLAGRTPLHYAVANDQLDSVKLLLELGADPDIADKEFGVIPLHWATGSGNLEIIKLLAPKTQNIDARNKDNLSSADMAFIDGNSEIVDFLVSQGATIHNAN